MCQLVATTPIQWPVKRGTNWLMCSALRRIILEDFNNVAWFKCVAKCGTDHPEWDLIAGINDHWNVSIIKDSHIYSVERSREFLKIRDIADPNNATLYRCTVTYYNDPTKISLDHETDHIYLLFKQEGNIYTYANIKEYRSKNSYSFSVRSWKNFIKRQGVNKELPTEDKNRGKQQHKITHRNSIFCDKKFQLSER